MDAGMVQSKQRQNRDSMLVRNILEGDIQCFSTLICNYQEGVYRFLYKMTLSHEDAEDLVQEVFVRVYNHLYQYNSKWSFSTWLYQIAINVFKSEYKKKKKLWTVEYNEEQKVGMQTEAYSPEVVLEAKVFLTS